MLTILIAEFHQFGGSQRAMLTTARALHEKGLKLQVVFPCEGEATSRYRQAGLPVHVLPAPARLLEFGGGLARLSTLHQLAVFVRYAIPYSRRVRRFMHDTNSEVIHCNTSRAMVIGSFWPRLAGKSVVWHVRAQADSGGRGVERYCRVFATRIIAICSATTRRWPPRLLRKTQVIFDGIAVQECQMRSLSASAASACRTVLSDSAPLVVMVASLTPFKGHQYLIDAAPQLQARPLARQPQFLLIGTASSLSSVEQSYESELRRRVSMWDLENVRFMGWVEDPLPLVRLASMVVLPSVESDEMILDGKTVIVRGGEAFPAATLEAMALGKPVICTDNAGLPEQVIHDETGLVVRQRDSVALANAIQKLLDVPDLIETFGAAGMRRASTMFDHSMTVTCLLNFYQQLFRASGR
jgi:glycosyltransferase involved in cell wall biosynthesis